MNEWKRNKYKETREKAELRRFLLRINFPLRLFLLGSTNSHEIEEEEGLTYFVRLVQLVCSAEIKKMQK